MNKLDAPKSTHRVEVVKVKKEPHPNADNLSLVRVFEGGHVVVVGSTQWQDGDLGAYVVPDSVVPTHKPEFAFLKQKPIFNEEGKVVGNKIDESLTHARVKVKRLRGIFSEGLLVPAPPGAKEGDDVASLLGVTRYEPPELNAPGKGLYFGGESASPPPVASPPKYDLESFNRYHFLLSEGEEVVVTEKIHGCNARYLFHEGTPFCGSRTEWKKEFPDFSHVTRDWLLSRGVPEEKVEEQLAKVHTGKPPRRNLWWQLYRDEPSIAKFCEAHPGFFLYGEGYGQVQDLQYGTKPGQVLFASFDIWDSFTYRYLEYDACRELWEKYGVPQAPLLYRGPYSRDVMRALVDGPTTIPGASHCREGIVVRPVKSRYNEMVGRVVLKLVSNAYLERA